MALDDDAVETEQHGAVIAPRVHPLAHLLQGIDGEEIADPRRYNGAIFLGLNGIAVKSHGSTDALGFANAIGVAVDMSIHGFIEKIKAELGAFHIDLQPKPEAAVG